MQRSDNLELHHLIEFLLANSPKPMSEGEKAAFRHQMMETYVTAEGRAVQMTREELAVEEKNILKQAYRNKSLIKNLKTFRENYVDRGSVTTMNNGNLATLPLTMEILEQIEAMDLDELNKADEEGFTALHYAMLAHNVHVVAALHKKGVNIEAVNQHGQTPLALALSQLSYIKWTSADFTSAVQYLLYQAKANRGELEENVLATLIELETINWKTRVQLRKEEKFEKQKEHDLEGTAYLDKLRRKEQKFLKNNFVRMEEDTSFTAAKVVTDAVVLQKEAGVEVKDQFFALTENVLDKIAQNSPVLERILYLFARFARQELGNAEAVKVLALTRYTVGYFYKDTPMANGVCTHGNVVAFALNIIKDLLEKSEAYLKGSEKFPPHQFKTMLHEILHMLMNKYFNNNGKMCLPVHLNENWKMAFAIKENFKHDFAHVRGYLALHPESKLAKKIENELINIFNFTENKKDETPYEHSDMLAEVPAVYINLLVECEDFALLEQLLPNTTSLLMQVLNDMYQYYHEKFPDSKIVQYYTGPLRTPAESQFCLKFNEISAKMNEDNAEKEKEAEIKSEPKASALQLGFLSSLSHSENNKEMLKQIKLLTKKHQLNWKFNNKEGKATFWAYVSQNQFDVLGKIFAENGLEFQFKKVAKENKWVVMIEGSSFVRLGADRSALAKNVRM